MNEQEQILGEVKQQLDEKKRAAVKNYVIKKLKEIQTAKDRMEEAKQELADEIAEKKDEIAEAEEAIRAVESGDFKDALESKDKLTELPITLNWSTFAATSTGTSSPIYKTL